MELSNNRGLHAQQGPETSLVLCRKPAGKECSARRVLIVLRNLPQEGNTSSEIEPVDSAERTLSPPILPPALYAS
jgi:hypothetical protein